MRKRYVVLVLLVAAAFLISMTPQPVRAHAPGSVTLSYDYSTKNLSVTISHSVSNPNTHYVMKVTLKRNSNQIAVHNYTSQPTNNIFTYYYNVTASDGDILSATADCNLGGSNSGTVKAAAPDETDPTVMITSPSNGTEVTTPTITVSGTASDNKGLSKVQVKVNEEAWADASGKATWTYQATLIEGMNNISAKAIDTSDNEAMMKISVLYNATPPPDEIPPGVQILSPSDNSTFDMENITISGSSSDNEAVSVVEIRVNSGEWSMAVGTVVWSANITLIEGNNTIEARATDTSDNTANDSIMVKFSPQAPPDTTSPEIVIQAPTNGTVVAIDEVTVSGTASDDRGVSVVEARVNNGIWNTASGTISWSIKLSLMEGNNTLEVRAWDDAGNNAMDSVIVVYDPGEPPDTEDPMVAIISPVEDQEFREPGITVSGNASDNSCTCRIEVRINEGNWQIANGRQNWSIDVQLIPGTNVIEARAFDDSGNTGFDTVTVIYNDTEPPDEIPPVIEIISPANRTTVNEPLITVSGNASDNEDLEIVQIKLNEDEWVSVNGTTKWSIDLNLDEGENLIKARAIDLEGNEIVDNITVVYEKPYIQGELDGVVTDGEYRASYSLDDGNFMIYWDFEDDVWKVALMVNTTGWVSLGLDPSSQMMDSDMIIGWVDDEGRVFIIDAFSTEAVGPHPPDTELGGIDDIIDFGGTEADGWTTIEFTRETNSTDTYDRNVFEGQVLDIIWGYSGSDEFSAYHNTHRGTVQDFNFTIDKDIPVDDDDDDDDIKPPDDDDDDDGKDPAVNTATIVGFVVGVLVILLIIIGLIIFVGSKKGKEEEEE